ncbi:hypothetical protein EYR41_010761 [Orbilia oligospora]|uniref:Uncharacterized protein n=1 Tax=Orbilia oligospora TaxID=2813651 RepID=A0A8H2DTM7_ORBOL|nr:hypothetical protein EYR41_010761 [Orbilia oligospora]
MYRDSNTFLAKYCCQCPFGEAKPQGEEPVCICKKGANDFDTNLLSQQLEGSLTLEDTEFKTCKGLAQKFYESLSFDSTKVKIDKRLAQKLEESSTIDDTEQEPVTPGPSRNRYRSTPRSSRTRPKSPYYLSRDRSRSPPRNRSPRPFRDRSSP